MVAKLRCRYRRCQNLFTPVVGGLSNSTKATLNVPTRSARIWYIMIG